ncbi:adenylate/guanylate cyclase domain-containing protein [Conexibacter sp. SYSU D00693]|uniref:adenylate/guanylate cyclase domain-containing protein n=1 Tax=Conexibacter sp. SYSU D00693 TaxID=2812560 RepID=UPI00196AA72A|nr:adenylate/guanylate cyclase domain-containing protein [Conexibacter sp. SYSU D00693]
MSPSWRWVERRLIVWSHLVNLGGAAAVSVYFLVILPPDTQETKVFSVPIGIALALTAALVGGWSARRSVRLHAQPVLDWLPTGTPPTDQVRDIALRLPAFMARITVVRWVLAAVVFGPLALIDSSTLAVELGTTLLASAFTVAAAEFLVAERVLRPVVARVLDWEAPPSAGSLGVGTRLLLAWILCTAIPVVMLAMIPVGRDVETADELVAPIWFVAVATLCAGFLATKLATNRVAVPLRELREATDAVGRGDLRVRVPVDDASEVGRLQAGFNQLVAGLQERERLRDLMDRSMGRDVAREALERGAALGGQVRTVSVLFVDVVGSTALASRERPERVVELLNAFFTSVVETVERHGGFVNKFEGDAALCIFGAPADQPAHATCALAAARDLRGVLDAWRGLDAGIGVSCGEAVAGWIGAESRFEYTVIGDPVNEAARLTELAKDRDGGLLASATTIDAADPEEREHWRVDGEVLLRGRPAPTRLAVPRLTAEPTAPAPAEAVRREV